jgi:nicotinate-nucleotide adenylyltransferase
MEGPPQGVAAVLMLLAFFGGAFDPPHMGHYLAAAYYLAAEPKGELWIIPSAKHPYGKQMAPFADRLRWCKRLAKMLGPRAKASALENTIKADKIYTSLLVEKLHRLHPKATLRMLVGADAYADRTRWHDAENLLKRLEFFPIGRGERTIHDRDTILAMPDVSSTEIRERFKKGQSNAGLVPAVVLEDVLARGLYR